MTRIQTFNEEARRRISRSVRFTEALPQDVKRPRLPRGAGSGGVLCQAVDDIDHNRVGKAIRVKAAKFDEAEFTQLEGETVAEVWNPGLKVWKNALIWIDRVALADVGETWAIVDAWSATQLRGVAVSAIPSGMIAPISSPTFLDGDGPDTVSIYNPGGDIEEGASVSGTLVWTGSESRWEVVTAGAGGSSGSGYLFGIGNTASATAGVIPFPTVRTSMSGLSVSADKKEFTFTETGVLIVNFSAEVSSFGTLLVEVNAGSSSWSAVASRNGYPSGGGLAAGSLHVGYEGQIGHKLRFRSTTDYVRATMNGNGLF